MKYSIKTVGTIRRKMFTANTAELEKLRVPNSRGRCRRLFFAVTAKVGWWCETKVDVEVVVVCRCVVVVLWVRWSGVGGPGQSFDNGVVRVDHPAAALLMKDCTMVVVKEVHGVFLTSRGIFCGSTPSKECDDKGVGILVELPGVVDDAGKFVVVMGLVVGDANALGKKSRVVGKVECAG